MILKNNKRIDGCSDTVPIGTLNPFLGSTAPYGYLLCQGQKVSKTTYKELYEICGDTFGQSTDTEFYLPDLRGQTIAGYKEGDSTFGTLGGLIGSLTHLHSTGNHTLIVAEMPSHSHWGIFGDGGAERKAGYGTGTTHTGTLNEMTDVAWERLHTGDSGGNEAHNHGNTSSTSSVQPTIILNWIVKAFQLMPNQSYVENSLESNSTINSLSAAKGKELNEKFDNYVTLGSLTPTITAPIFDSKQSYYEAGGYWEIVQFGKVVWIQGYVTCLANGPSVNVKFINNAPIPKNVSGAAPHWQFNPWEQATTGIPLIVDFNTNGELCARQGVSGCNYFIQLVYITE